MRTRSRSFSTQVELPCTVLCGLDGALKLDGTAVTIDPASMVLRLRSDSQAFPRVGDHVDLEVHLPVNVELAGAKDLTARAQIVDVTEVGDGVRQFTLSFRKTQFKERGKVIERRKPKAAAQGWEM